MFIGLVFFIGIFLYRVVLGNMLIHSVDFTYSNDYNPKKVTLLLYLGAMKGFEGAEGDYNASNYRYRDLHYLVARGDIENVRLYLRLGGDVNLGGDSKSALYIALSRGDNEMAKLLLEYGARVMFNNNFLLLNLLDRKITDEVAELVVNRALAKPNMSVQYLCWASRGLSYNGFSSRAFHLMLEHINEPLEDITCENWGLLYAMLDNSFRDDGFGIDEIKAVFLKAKEQGCKECMNYVARFYYRGLDWVERVNVMAEVIYKINLYKINSDTKKEQEMLDLLEFFILNGGDVNSYIPSSYKPETLLENTKYRNRKYHHLKSVIALLIKYGAK
ncbi:ankyrin repeat domain-containing protein [Helicobacter sp. MIT 03-1614]|uniref:ankyrin repeat domain-containing protein n=1 Tax=Helicobacter sp. MIT 03-1614 TaxID=1548147 RepID=UPI000513A063|nr:ankyrin repeat domain-containing protein [Helicobacter sp. MIT 03-1614]TLD88436.1 ankyrin repeat domain-containing protein [Helicobacter sp. MIT 03-1614]